MVAPAIASTTSVAASASEVGRSLQGGVGPARGEVRPRTEKAARRMTQRFVDQNNRFESPTLVIDATIEPTEITPVLAKHLASQQSQVDATVVQIWEGTVLSVDEGKGCMHAVLHAKRGQVEDHEGEIYFDWVMDQDRDLVAIGAVFYLTIYKSRLRGGTIVNSQELRFRRLPAWSRQQVAKVGELAAQIAHKMKARPLAE